MELNIEQILKILPHRYPFLLVDKILELDIENATVTGQKNVTVNESFFNGHFPGKPIMPGVLIVEALAQVTAVLGMSMMNSDKFKLKSNDNKIFILAGINKVRIKLPVVPGDILTLKSTIIKHKSSVCVAKTVAYVGDNISCSADITAVYKDI